MGGVYSVAAILFLILSTSIRRAYVAIYRQIWQFCCHGTQLLVSEVKFVYLCFRGLSQYSDEKEILLKLQSRG